MKQQIAELVADSLTRDIPLPLTREVTVLRHPGKVSVLVGMRRTGKTWLCFSRMQELLLQGVERHQLLYLNFEDDRWSGLTAKDLKWIPECFYALHPENHRKTCYFFFDEIQLVPGWEPFVRRLLDSGSLELTITGSSAKLLSKEVGTSLRGRGLTTEVFPLSFREFCRFHGIDLTKERAPFGASLRANLQDAANQFRVTGGFPEVQTMNRTIRDATIQEYVSAVILRDVIERHSVSNGLALRSLVRHILQSPATLLSVNKFWQSLKSMGIAVTKSTLMDFLEHLNDAYLCSFSEIGDPSIRRRQVNPKKVYAVDNGLVNAFGLPSTSDNGRQLENMIYMAIRAKGCHPDYWKTREGYEIDLVVEIGKKRTLIQACWSIENTETAAREIRALKSGMRELNVSNSLIITWDDPEREQDGIRIVPYWKWAVEP